MKSMILCSLAVGAFIAIGACGHDDEHDHTTPSGHTTPYASCNVITAACHELDVAPGPIHDCHDLAHGAKDDATCAAKKDECLRTCSPDAGGGGAADAGGGG